MLTSSSTHSGIEALYKRPGYDPIKDFVHISRIATIPMVLVTRPDAPYKSTAELSAYGKKNALRYGYGSGSAQIAAATYSQMANVPADAIPYKSQPPAVTGLLGSQIDFMVADTSVVMSFLHGGRLNGLAITSPKRVPELPNVPTMAEAGYKDFDPVVWVGLAAPAGRYRRALEQGGQRGRRAPGRGGEAGQAGYGRGTCVHTRLRIVHGGAARHLDVPRVQGWGGAAVMHQAKQKAGPLTGIRVLDLTSVIMGPVCTQILADYGATVVKIEPPEGDVMRHAGAKRVAGMGAMFLHANQGKQSVVLDLKAEADIARLREMLPSFDVLVHNVRPQAMARLGLDDASIRALHPKLVYVELMGYAEGGPLHGRAAYDDVIQAQTGLAELFARQTGGAPQYVPTLIADRVTGLTAAHATIAAPFGRQHTGRGETIRVSMFESIAAFVLGDHLGGASFEPAGGQWDTAGCLRPIASHNARATAISLRWSTTTSTGARSFAAIDELATFEADPRFQTAAARAKNYDTIYGYLSDVMAARSTEEWIALLERADIPHARVNRVEDLIDDAQLRAVGFFDERDDGNAGQRRIAARFRSPAAIQDAPPAPALGDAAQGQ
ncbi:L-carnitine dehydratase/bile acid-inducible protein F (modular protein) [Cupriavidus taiwanensis]|uniref:tripartite tricarboxylate transporter substrate-binding protein n=1 Tax=Cupriavidus taiwanensis TaxID=164546 RepID=UPI000E1530DE|nr:tripartite tricarboxylate transporter substrate-binding protein [Cupriavidus taiwanensis]SOZ18283.1 L-carnitine dehydratase/bile acid-inducible protein F (modular protein) [Cupriavidus taiwanensis]SOZ31245.1 L-carnitine dehydratase/bile acid-inducible protein F (modular protein) [Cupriavidus taiwanensis]SOZ47322.1 L-carnitine dehydratase/bile acid-inducible protein F (modular protein) [Cupriavidus taiwanensis]